MSSPLPAHKNPLFKNWKDCANNLGFYSRHRLAQTQRRRLLSLSLSYNRILISEPTSSAIYQNEQCNIWILVMASALGMKKAEFRNLSVLTDVGAEAEKCRNALTNINFDLCYSSPISRAKGETILIVTHKSILRALICTALGLGPERFRAIDINSGGIFVFTFN